MIRMINSSPTMPPGACPQRRRPENAPTRSTINKMRRMVESMAHPLRLAHNAQADRGVPLLRAMRAAELEDALAHPVGCLNGRHHRPELRLGQKLAEIMCARGRMGRVVAGE